MSGVVTRCARACPLKGEWGCNEVTKWAKDKDSTSEADEVNNNDSVTTIEAEEAKAKPGKAKQASNEKAATETLTTITDDCNDVLTYLQAVAVQYL